MHHQYDLKSRVHELFQQVADRLDPQLDKLIQSGCRIIDDTAIHDELSKAFIKAFLKDELNRLNLMS